MDGDDEEREPYGHIRSWLRDSGAALELRVAASFVKAFGVYEVHHARYYIDSDRDGEHKLREIDIVARTRQYPEQEPSNRLEMAIVVECKATQGSWVLFTTGESAIREGHEFIETLPRVGRRDPRGWDTNSPVLAPREPVAYHVADIRRRERTETTNPAWDAVRQAVDAARALTAESHTATAIYLPVVVTASQLYRVSLADDGEPVVNRVPAMPMLARVRNPIPRRMGSEQAYTVERIGLWVINEAGVDAFAQQAGAAGRDIRARIPAESD